MGPVFVVTQSLRRRHETLSEHVWSVYSLWSIDIVHLGGPRRTNIPHDPQLLLINIIAIDKQRKSVN